MALPSWPSYAPPTRPDYLLAAATAIIVSRSSVTSRSDACGELWSIRPKPGIRGLADAYRSVAISPYATIRNAANECRDNSLARKAGPAGDAQRALNQARRFAIQDPDPTHLPSVQLDRQIDLTLEVLLQYTLVARAQNNPSGRFPDFKPSLG